MRKQKEKQCDLPDGKMQEKKEQRTTYIYIVKCEDGSLYTGITTDVKRRMKEHFEQGHKGAKYTHTRLVVSIEMVWAAESYASAARLEYAIKKLKRADKCRLIENPDSILKSLFPKLEKEQYSAKKEYCGLVSDFLNIVE